MALVHNSPFPRLQFGWSWVITNWRHLIEMTTYATLSAYEPSDCRSPRGTEASLKQAFNQTHHGSICSFTPWELYCYVYINIKWCEAQTSMNAFENCEVFQFSFSLTICVGFRGLNTQSTTTSPNGKYSHYTSVMLVWGLQQKCYPFDKIKGFCSFLCLSIKWIICDMKSYF